MNKNEKLLTLKQAGEMLNVKPVTLRKWDREGKLKAVRIGSRRDRRYRFEDIEQIVGGPQIDKYDIQEMYAALHTLVPTLEAYSKGLAKTIGRGVSKTFTFVNKGYVRFAVSYNEIYGIGEYLVSKFKNSPHLFDKIISKIEEYFKETDKLLEQVKSPHFNPSAKKLEELYKKVSKMYMDCFSHALIIEPLDAYLFKTLNGRIKVDPKKYSDYFYALTSPLHESFVTREKQSILGAAKELKNDHQVTKLIELENSKDLLKNYIKENRPEIYKKVKKHQNDFIWIRSNYVKGSSLAVSDVVDLVKEQLKEADQIEKELKKIDKYLFELKKEKEKIHKKLGLDAETSELLSLIEKNHIIHDQRKEWFLKIMFIFEHIFNKISKEYYVPIKILRWSTFDEIKAIFRGEVLEESEVEKRKERSAVITDTNGHKFYFGSAAKRLEKEKLKDRNLEVNLIKGMPVAEGKIVGEAKVVHSAVEAEREVESGNILVVPATNPNFKSVINQVSGIVTNDGDLNSHAAVSARERGIPCIVGTRIGTDIVNDGDIIEVNANHGIIYIVKKASKKKKKEKKVEWQEYIRAGITQHIIGPIAESLRIGLKKHFGVGVNYLMNFYEGDTLFWYYDKKDLYRVGRAITDKLSKRKEFENSFFKLWQEKSKELFEIIKSNQELENLDDKELADLYKKYKEIYFEWASASLTIDATDESLMIDVTKRVKKILKSKLGSFYTEKEFNRVYNILTSPSKHSYLNDERKMILELALDILNKKIKIGGPSFEKRSNSILTKFWWTNLGWKRGEAKSIADIKAEVRKLKNSKEEIEEELNELKGYEKEIKKEKDSLEREYQLLKDKELAEWARLSDKLVFWHDFRKEVQMKSNFWEYKIIDEIERRTGVSSKLLDWCDNQEIIDFLKTKKIDANELNQRSSYFLALFEEGKVTKLSGKKAKKKHAQILGAELEETRDLQGISASPGTVVGEAYVGITPEQANKIKKGQILITGMTAPHYLPAMKKASAIITDEGGVTCHAAIVSREMGKPCIVGTKYATRLIKTGDRVEVRANHGVARILDKDGEVIKEKKVEKKNWFLIQERGDNIPFLPAVVPIFEMYVASPKLIANKPSHYTILVFQNGGGKYYPDKKEWQWAENYALNKTKKDPQFIEKLLKKFKKELPRLRRIDKKIKEADLDQVSDKGIYEFLNKYIETYKEVYPWSEPFAFWLSQPLTDYLEGYLRDILKTRYQEKLFGEYFEILITPPEMAFTTREEKALLEIALEISKNTQLRNVFVNKSTKQIIKELNNHNKINKMLDKHTNDFTWVPFDYGNPSWDKEYFVETIAEMFKMGLNIVERYKALNDFYKDIIQKQKGIFTELGIDRKHQKLFRALQIATHTIDYKKETLTQSHFAVQKLMDEIQKRLRLTRKQTMRLTLEDIRNAFVNKESVDKKILDERYKLTVDLVYDNKSKYMWGKDATKFLREQGLTKKKIKESKETKGICASGGKTIGSAKIIKSPKEFKKMKNGDVLVTYMTTPEYVPVMRKASAIVTNEGGLTCHAAIVSREMNIPCIVGTKNATGIFKDGDKLEIRANHGVARKI